MQLLPPGTRPAALRDHQADTDAAEILSDTLSATTPFASPRGDAPQQLSGAVAPVTPREATPGFTPPPSPDQLPRSTPAAANVEPLPWQDARPPSSLPGERNSWLYIPLLHAGAGNLTERAQHDWRSRPGLGPRFWELASLLRDAPPVMPSALAQTLLAVAECEAHDTRRDISAADRASAAAFSAMPDAPLPLSAALLLCMEPDGYLTAAAQAAFLESYAGASAAAAAQSLANDARHEHQPPAAPATRRRRRGARRRSAARAVPTLASSECADERVPACPPAAGDHDAAANATPAGVPDVAWLALDTVDLAEELRCPVPTLQDVPPFMRAAVRAALTTALQRLRDSAERVPALDEAPASRAWKLFLLAPRMLLARTHLHGARGRDELLARAAAFRRGEWAQLLVAARRSTPVRKQRADVAAEDVAERKREQACAKVRRGELSRARHILTAAELAPGNEATWRLLADPARRPPQPRTPVPSEVADYQPSSPLQLGPTAIAAALRDAKRGGAAGLTGMRAEHLKVLLQDQPALELLAYAATRLANAQVPASIVPGLALARLTALSKPDGGVRGIATGDVFRRLVSRALAKGWATTFDRATRPYQFALQARAGTDALAAHVRVALDQDPNQVLVSLDGRSAYDSISRTSFLTALKSAAPELLPFVRLFYGRPSTYCWWDESGQCRDIAQGEGCEQGDPLAPALFALGQHAALCQASSALHGSERLLAFLDDLYVLTTRERAREARDTVVQAVQEGCGIASNEGKTRVYSHAGGEPPPGIAELGADVWRGNKRSSERGLKVLGTPIGHPHFIASWAEGRMLTERELLNQLPRLPDLQCAWLLLAMCASPRANHALRTVPPLDIAGYAQAHDDAVWETLQACLGGVASGEADGARKLATLPASLGGLGLASAVRTAPAAYWAAWADALPVLGERAPALAEACVRQLEGRDAETTCLRSAAVARNLLQAEGWQECPSWRAIADGARPPVATDRSLGDWPHGWQHSASRTHNLHFRERTLLPDMSPSACALLRSQAGPHAGAWLTAIPADPATTLSPQAMQLALRRRLRLPLPLRLNRCGPSPGCGGLVDVFGDHALACPRTGLLARRAKIVERAWVRVAREAVGADGQVVPQQWLCATTAPGVAPDDRRRLDLVIYGASPMGGALCCDATLVSPLTRTGQPQPGTVADDGAMLRVAERRKRAAYPELSSGGPQRLLVLGSEIGGRWNETAQHLVRDLARVRAQRAPPALRAAATSAWTRRWWATLAVALQQAVSSTALGSPWPAPPHASQPPGPELDRVLDLAEAAGPSRLPLRP